MKTKYFKRFFSFLLVAILGLSLVACKDKKDESQKTDEETKEDINWQGPDDAIKARGKGLENAVVVFHYQRKNDDYKQWGVWVWDAKSERKEIANKDDFGVYFKMDLGDPEEPLYHVTTINYIYFMSKDGKDWTEKDDFSADRSVDLTEDMLDENNEIHLYSFQGEESMYFDAEKQRVVQFIKSASLTDDSKKVEVKTNAPALRYELYSGETVVASGETKGNSTLIALPKPFSIQESNLKVRVYFSEDFYKEKVVNFNSYYDTAAFKDAYTYKGNDLGVTLGEASTTFRVWAPISSSVKVNLYSAGHAVKDGNEANPGVDTPTKTLDLKQGEKGVWSLKVDENLKGNYYTYTVVNSGKEVKDIVDPYAKAVGFNGNRGYIADFSTLNPEDWSYEYTRPYTQTQLVVYELHVRDLTMDDTWTGTEANRGKFLGMCETGTTYTDGKTTVTTGFDHIKELGVNAVQILPFYDQDNVENETDPDKVFNWGYNPKNYNALEGQYSSNPYDAEARIKEFKMLSQAYREANIEIIMDVVYNHMAGLGGSSFEKLVPGYFFRFTKTGAASNGSGCGNETASDRPMFRQFMIDSTEFWASEYNISGFRFDLMGLHDYETMNLVAKNLKDKVDPNIVVYGEPWTGGTSTLKSDLQATTANVGKLEGVAIFNDRIRDAIKGSTGSQTGEGWVQGSQKVNDSLLNGMKGLQFSDPLKQINYVSCHDNNTLADKLLLSGVEEAKLQDANLLSQGMVMTAQGISFMQAGEELLRTKLIYDKDGKPVLDKNGKVQYSHNSYNLNDATNSLKWDDKIKYNEVFNQYKALVNLKAQHKLFQYDSNIKVSNVRTKLQDKYFFVNQIPLVNSLKTEDPWSSAIVIYSSKRGTGTYKVPLGEWKVAYASGDTTAKVGDTVTEVKFGAYTMVVLYKANPDYVAK